MPARRPSGGNFWQALRALPGWPVWALAEPLRSYVIVVVAGAAGIVAVLASRASWRGGDVLVFCGLGACAILATEATARVREVHGTVLRDLHGVWYLAGAITLPPGLAVLLPVPVTAYRLWRVRSGVVHRRVFSCASYVIAYGAAGIAFRRVPWWFAGPVPGGGKHVLTWVAAVIGCGVIAFVINNGVNYVALRLTDRKQRMRDLFGNRASAASDMLDLSLGATVTLVVSVNPVLMALALPAVVLCRAYVMQAQLGGQGRVDTSTGLFTRRAWRAEAEVMWVGAARAGGRLAVAVAEIDDFRSVQDSAGEDVGSRLRRGVGLALQDELRDQDVIGTFSDRGFIIALPGMNAGAARRCGQRLRDRIASDSLTIEAGAEAGFVFRLTVSVGVAAALPLAGQHGDLAGLVDAAVAALGSARAGGWSQVYCVQVGPPGHDQVSSATGSMS
jgi:diguanylate cyclase (GGDEF)-like protein